MILIDFCPFILYTENRVFDIIRANTTYGRGISMNKLFLNCYIIISILIAIIDVILSVSSVKKNNSVGRYLGYACAGAAVVDISYLISILNDSYFCMSLMSSIYFISIDLMLVCLLIFTVYFTRRKFTKLGKIALKGIISYTLFEIIIFLINPVKELAIHYVRRDTLIAKYSYQMKPLYWMHLLFTYFLVAVILILLIRKSRRIPKEYRAQYYYVVLGILAIVFVNAVFLYLPGLNVYNLLDYSICGYSLTAFLLYWSCFNYSSHGMLNRLKTSIFENIDQGIVLFDYDNNLTLFNENANHLLGGIQKETCSYIDDFVRDYHLPPDSGKGNDSFQYYVTKGEKIRPLRCDIRKLKNEEGQLLGQLFVFTDTALETDLLTGFQNWESFRQFILETNESFTAPVIIAICDINNLSVINSTQGNYTGNQKIKKLADTMRKYMPEHTYFVRGLEANLIALCNHTDRETMHSCLSQVAAHFEDNIQYAVSTTSEDKPDILDAIHTAAVAMKTKKLLDKHSVHSEMLTSLIRALKECDNDTENHVKRTQLMGAQLGKRIGLTDFQQSQLSLLCLLHDIGKIGIPLEILNKPGKLSDEEWAIIKSHTKKGYEIANSNTELKGIAQDILHHHERWDGKGYPDRLREEQIPLLSRIIAVVDSYDAMTNDRPYRRAMSVSDAVEELKRCAGSQFDPHIVSEFICMLKETPDTIFRKNTESEKAKPELAENKFDHSQIKNHSVHPIPFSRYLLNEEMTIVSIDENFEKLTGYTSEDIQKNTIIQSDLIPEEDRTEYLCQTSASLAKSPLVFQEHKLRRKDGSYIYVFCFGRKYYDSAVRAERSEIIIADISNSYSIKMMTETEQQKAQSMLKHWENNYKKDSLTGLLNHASFQNNVERELTKRNSRIMMLMIDVDLFKEYNDTFGHHNGDKFLILVAHSLHSSLRKKDYSCRMGGDEFAAVLFFDQDASTSAMEERAQQIFDKISMTLKTIDGKTGISMGAFIAEAKPSFIEMYEKSDKALHQAKKNGRGKLIFYK